MFWFQLMRQALFFLVFGIMMKEHNFVLNYDARHPMKHL